MRHNWYDYLGTATRCSYCGVKQREAKSADCNDADVAAKWGESANLVRKVYGAEMTRAETDTIMAEVMEEDKADGVD